MKRKRIIIFFFASLITCLTQAQEKYQIRQITFNNGEVGFFDWSPDGNAIVYTKQTGIWKFLIDEGDPKRINPTQSQHPSWSPDGQYIVFDSDSGRAISVISSNGGVPIRIVPDEIPIIKSGYPLWSPDGEEILFQGESLALYLLTVRTGKLLKIEKFEDLIPVPKSWSPNGNEILISLRNNQKREANLWLVSKTDDRRQLTYDGESGYLNGDFSPDGSLIVYSLYKDHKVWIMSSKGGKPLQLTYTTEARDSDPRFSPDGKKIAFKRVIAGVSTMWTLELNTEDIKKELDLLNY